MGRTDSSDQFRKVIILYICIGYAFNVMRQSTCSEINPLTVDNFAPLFNYTPVGWTMTRPNAIHFSLLGPELFYLLLGTPGLN